MEPPASQRSVRWVLGALLFFCLVYAHQRRFNSATPVSRLDLLHAWWQQHTFAIDAYHTNTPDKAVFEGHYYSDKAPGTVALALLAFAVSATILDWAKIPLDSETGWLVSSWITCVGSLALITALGGVAMFAWLQRWVPPRAALVTVLALYLGAAPLPYSTMLFSHALVVGLISIALWAIDIRIQMEIRNPKSEISTLKSKIQNGPSGSPAATQGSQVLGTRSREVIAGGCCGWALASEYSSGLIIAGLFLWLLAEDWRRAARFGLAAALPLLLVPAYSLACFGNPFILPYSLQASFPAMQHGLYAIQWPDPVTAWNLLFTPTRGLFFWTPFLVMAGFGYWILARYPARVFLLTYAAPVLHVIVLSGRSWDWQAGYALGPRLLAPILPLLALPCALGCQRWSRLGWILAIYSIGITTLATLTEATPSSIYSNPLTELHIPRLLRGEFSPNLGSVFGLPPFLALALFCLLITAGSWWLWRRLLAPRNLELQPLPSADDPSVHH